MANARIKYYWDACIWIELITQSEDNDRFKRCQHIFQKAQDGEVELWTSTFTLAEVYKRKCDDGFKSLHTDENDKFESFFTSGLIKPILVDTQVGQMSGRLSRQYYRQLRKPQDAVHIASCLVGNIGVLHTFDKKDLIPLSGKIPMKNGGFLKIIEPPQPQGQLEILR